MNLTELGIRYTKTKCNRASDENSFLFFPRAFRIKSYLMLDASCVTCETHHSFLHFPEAGTGKKFPEYCDLVTRENSVSTTACKQVGASSIIFLISFKTSAKQR